MHSSAPRGAASHGGDIIATAQRLGCRVSELIDMSSNLSPLGMPPGLRAILTARLDEIGCLPETGSETLRQLFAARYGCRSDEVLVGNGTTEFIFGVPASLQPRRALLVNPTYADYRLASEWAGVAIRDFSLLPGEQFQLDLDRLAGKLTGGELVFLCNPNNPTGTLTPTAELHRFIAARPETRFLVDESYLPFTREESLLEQPLLPNLLILSSFSKIYGIPGLRLGFLTAAAENMAKLAARRKPWGVNRLAQIAGEFLLTQGEGHRQAVLEFLQTHLPPFLDRLASLPGITVYQGATHFILARLTGTIPVSRLQEQLLASRIMIRNCGNFEGLDESFFRVSLKEDEANSLFLETAGRILEAAACA